MTTSLAALGAEPALRNVLIAAHAVSAAVAFLLGATVAVRRAARPGYARAYVIALLLMTVFVAGAVILDWHTLGTVTGGLFAALIALACYTVWRGWRAQARLGAAGAGLHPASDGVLSGAIDDLGFTLITLFTGFV